MNKTIVLTGDLRSTNSIYKSRVIGKFASVYMTHEGKALKESYQCQAKSQWHLRPIPTEIELNVRLYFGSKRKHDIDNYNKILLDSLTGILWVDDSQIIKLTVEKFYCKENPRIELECLMYSETSTEVLNGFTGVV